MRSGNKLVAYLKLIAVVIIWGGNYHAAKYLVKDTDIYTVSFLRFALAALMLLFIQHNKHGAMGYKKSPIQWWMLIAIGFVGIFIYNIFFFGAESLIPANNVAILYAFTPCITVVFSSIFLKQKISCLGYVGVIIALVGTIGVINTSDTNCGKFFCGELFRHLSLGELLAILATVSMSCYNILNRKAALMNLDPLHITTFGAVFGAIFLFITFLLFGGKVILLWHKP
ncbi:MAG: DMT family transporter, partial [Burkholderiales bacterium]